MATAGTGILGVTRAGSGIGSKDWRGLATSVLGLSGRCSPGESSILLATAVVFSSAVLSSLGGEDMELPAGRGADASLTVTRSLSWSSMCLGTGAGGVIGATATVGKGVAFAKAVVNMGVVVLEVAVDNVTAAVVEEGVTSLDVGGVATKVGVAAVEVGALNVGGASNEVGVTTLNVGGAAVVEAVATVSVGETADEVGTGEVHVVAADGGVAALGGVSSDVG